MSATATPSTTNPPPHRLQVGGTLDPKKHIYIRRPADQEVLRQLLAGEYINVLTSRQMGKSSLMVQTAYALQEQGVRFVSIDLAGELGTPDDATLYYQALLQRIARGLKLPIDMKAWWQEHELETNNQKLLRFFKDEVGGAIEAPVVIFLDEIDSTLKLTFTDDLFTALRTMNNERTFEEAFQKITFCLLGVATPNELIEDRRTTPYNVGQTLELRDFDATDDLTPLADALSTDAETGKALLARVLHWTGGHPYLTDRLCYALAAAGVATGDGVDQHVENAFRTLERVSSDVHVQQILRFVEERFTKGLDSLNLYARILNGAHERDQPSLAHAELKLSGLVKRDADGCLIVRNPIYARLFDARWVASTTPKRALARTRTYAIAASIALVLAVGVGTAYQVLVVAPEQRVLAARTQLEELQITIVQAEGREGSRLQFPENADQALLERAAPLMLALPQVVEVDLQTESYRDEPIEISDLTPLADLESLEVLDASYTQVSDVSPLSGLTGLQTLNLRSTQVTDVVPLSGLTGLQTLNLRDTQVTDMGPLLELTGLRELILWNTQVRDVGPLTGLTGLQALDLDDTQVKDVVPLSGLVGLQKLYLRSTQVTDVSPLTGLTGLQTLFLSSTQVSDVSPLSGLMGLQTLTLNSTQVSDVSALSGLTELQTLYLWNTQVSDVSPLSGLTGLQTLYLRRTQVSDVSPLSGLTGLQTLDLRDTQVTAEQVAALKQELARRGNTSVEITGP